MTAVAAEVRARLRLWPRVVASEPRQYLQEALCACRVMLDAESVTFAWEDPEEPWVVVATASVSSFDWREEGDPLEMVCESVARTPHLAVEVQGEVIKGCLFIAKQVQEDGWIDALADVAGVLLAHDMDHLITSRTAAREAVREERFRVARDLHDGLLQSFTGVVLQLETLHDMIEKAPADARRLITNVQGLIMADQRDLRSYVEQLRPRRRIDVPFDFLSRLTELKSRFETQWGIPITIDKESVDPLVAQSLGPETFRLIQEAVTNAAKHGAASGIGVRLSTRESRIWIDVTDDGSGFPFHGRRTLQEIRESGVGPSMLAERVAALNGDLAVESSGRGATVQISIPLGFSGG